MSDRILTNDITLNGLTLHRGQLVLLSTFSMGRDDHYFPPDAKAFRPDRWARTDNGGQQGTTPFAWLPMGFGPRACVGRLIAMNSLTVLIERLTSKLDLISLNEHELSLTMRLTGVPDDKVKVAAKLL